MHHRDRAAGSRSVRVPAATAVQRARPPLPRTPRSARDDRRRLRRVLGERLHSVTAFGFPESLVPAMSVADDERERVFEEAWEIGGGFRYMFATFSDIGVDPDANEAAAGFIRAEDQQHRQGPEDRGRADASRPLRRAGRCATTTSTRRSTATTSHWSTCATSRSRRSHPTASNDGQGVRARRDRVRHGFRCRDRQLREDRHPRTQGGATPREVGGGPRAHVGPATAGFPNLFMIFGPDGALHESAAGPRVPGRLGR